MSTCVFWISLELISWVINSMYFILPARILMSCWFKKMWLNIGFYNDVRDSVDGEQMADTDFQNLLLFRVFLLLIDVLIVRLELPVIFRLVSLPRSTSLKIKPLTSKTFFGFFGLFASKLISSIFSLIDYILLNN